MVKQAWECAARHTQPKQKRREGLALAPI